MSTFSTSSGSKQHSSASYLSFSWELFWWDLVWRAQKLLIFFKFLSSCQTSWQLSLSLPIAFSWSAMRTATHVSIDIQICFSQDGKSARTTALQQIRLKVQLKMSKNWHRHETRFKKIMMSHALNLASYHQKMTILETTLAFFLLTKTKRSLSRTETSWTKSLHQLLRSTKVQMSFSAMIETEMMELSVHC